jgi:thiamine-phosphate pyrophosphorylase
MSQTARLYLITPRLETVAAFLPTLDAALDAAPVDCVLLRAAATVSRDELAQAARAIQGRGAAALLEGEARDALRAGADGVHLAGAAHVDAALSALKPDRIVGVGALASRDDCMDAGEKGVDYLMFGEPKPDGYVPPLATTLERVEWWAEIFNVPCVGFANTLDAIAPLVEAGADFVALGDAIWADPRGPAAAVRDALTRLVRKVDA